MGTFDDIVFSKSLPGGETSGINVYVTSLLLGEICLSAYCMWCNIRIAAVNISQILAKYPIHMTLCGSPFLKFTAVIAVTYNLPIVAIYGVLHYSKRNVN